MCRGQHRWRLALSHSVVRIRDTQTQDLSLIGPMHFSVPYLTLKFFTKAKLWMNVYPFNLLCAFGFKLKNQFILLFNLLLLLFMSFTAPLVLFISLTILFHLTFTFIYNTFNKKNFNFSKISESQTNNLSNQRF